MEQRGAKSGRLTEGPQRLHYATGYIANLKGNCDIKLPTVYSRNSLPVPKEAIGKQADENRWPYLSGIKIKSINADIGLLIDSDVPQALQPCEIRQSQNGGPFATQTALGWVLSGPLIGRKETKITTANFVQASQTLDLLQVSLCGDPLYCTSIYCTSILYVT